MWSGQYYVIAGDYQRFVIIKVFPFESSNRKYVPCERFKLVIEWTVLGVTQISEKWLLGW
jgi:hypothetical protein